MSFTPAWRDVYIAVLAKGISVCGDVLAATALVLALQGSGGSGYAVSALLLAATVPIAAFAAAGGRLADRVDSRTLLATVGIAQAFVCAGLAFTDQMVAIIVLVSLLATGLAITQPTLSALIPSMVRPQDLPRASALSQTAGALGMIVGPALAGVLVGRFGLRVPLLLDAVSYLALVAAALLVRTRRTGTATARGAAASGAAVSGAAAASTSGATASSTVWRDPLLRTMVISIAAVVAAVSAINVVEVFFVRDVLGASAVTYGALEATFTVGMLAGAWLFVRAAQRARDSGALVIGVLVMLAGLCATLPAAAMAGTVSVLFPLWICGGALNGGMNVYAGVVVARRVAEPMRGRAYATLGGSVQGASMLGFSAGGFLVEAIEIRPLVAILGTAGIAVVSALLPSALTVARREAAAVTRMAEADGTAGLAGSAV